MCRPRYHVYALLSLCYEPIKPNYSTSAHALFVQLARTAAEHASGYGSNERYITLWTSDRRNKRFTNISGTVEPLMETEEGTRGCLMGYIQSLARLLEIGKESCTMMQGELYKIGEIWAIYEVGPEFVYYWTTHTNDRESGEGPKYASTRGRSYGGRGLCTTYLLGTEGSNRTVWGNSKIAGRCWQGASWQRNRLAYKKKR
jgi:hypothetical protein